MTSIKTVQDYINAGLAGPAAKMMKDYDDGLSHAFILSGNVIDYSTPTASLRWREYLTELFIANEREIIVYYDLASGVNFPPSMVDSSGRNTSEALFREIVGLNEQQQAPANAALAALQQAQGQQQGETPIPSSPAQALPLLHKLLITAPAAKAAVIVEFPEALSPNGMMASLSPDDRVAMLSLATWGLDRRIEATGNMAIMLTEVLEDIHPNIRAASRKWTAITVPLPNYDQRLEYVVTYLNDEDNGVALEPDLTPEAVASSTAGLGFMGMEDVFLRASGYDGIIRYEMVADLKAEIIRSEFGELLEVVEPEGGYETVGGLEHVKRYMFRSVINPMRDGNLRRVPMGVLFTGPPGTGKSILAEATAQEAGVNMVKLNIGGQIASKWQGEGERNLRRALAAIEQLGRVIVFVDEIEGSMSRGGSGNNQQESRIFQMMLEFMADTSHRGQVVFLAATNRPDLMDAALRRPGRFDDKIPFLIPNEEERELIWKVMAQKYQGVDTVNPKAVEATEGWTGAEIEGAARKAYQLTEDEEIAPADAQLEATQRLTPSTADIDFMTALAIDECNDRDLLPPQYQEAAIDKATVREQVRQYQEAEQRTGRRRRRR